MYHLPHLSSSTVVGPPMVLRQRGATAGPNSGVSLRISRHELPRYSLDSSLRKSIDGHSLPWRQQAAGLPWAFTRRSRLSSWKLTPPTFLYFMKARLHHRWLLPGTNNKLFCCYGPRSNSKPREVKMLGNTRKCHNTDDFSSTSIHHIYDRLCHGDHHHSGLISPLSI